MLVTSDVVRMTSAGLKIEFDAAYQKAQENADWQIIATEIPTTLPSQDYGWLGRGAVMQEFKARTEQQTLNQYTYNIADKIYDASLPIARKTLEDDQYGLVMIRVRGMGQEPTRHWNQLAAETLCLGAVTLCADGQYFIDVDHNESGTNQSNKTTSPLSDGALEIAEREMMLFTDDKGIPMEIKPNVLMVGPKLARVAADLTGSEVVVLNVGDGTAGTGATSFTPRSNYFKGRYLAVVNPYFRGAYDDYWALMDTTKEVKPVIIQSRSDVPISIETDMDEASAKIKEEYQFRVRGRYGAGYGLWQTIYMGIL